MDPALLPLAYLLPLGLVCVAWGSVPSPRLRESALAALVTAVVSAVAYVGFGFALQFGAIGLSPNVPPGLSGLDKAWSVFAGPWSLVGLEGFFATGEGAPAGLALVESLALHRLPLAMAAGLIPMVALGDRASRVARIAAGIVAGAIVFPIAGAWVWGGGWLAQLGRNLNLGHGAIDVMGSGLAFMAPACVALVALRFFGRIETDTQPSPELPSLHQPWLTLAGAVAFAIGWSAWAMSDPLLSPYTAVEFAGGAALGLVGASAAALFALAYGWLASGRIHALMVARGWLAGWIAVGASLWFIPIAAAVFIGALAGALGILAQFAAERAWRLKDCAGVIGACGVSGAWALIAAGLFGDGAFGTGWNGASTAQGVSGALAGDPGQLSAQCAALVAIGIFAVGVAALGMFPLALILRRTGELARSAESPPPPIESVPAAAIRQVEESLTAIASPPDRPAAPAPPDH